MTPSITQAYVRCKVSLALVQVLDEIVVSQMADDPLDPDHIVLLLELEFLHAHLVEISDLGIVLQVLFRFVHQVACWLEHIRELEVVRQEVLRDTTDSCTAVYRKLVIPRALPSCTLNFSMSSFSSLLESSISRS